MDDRDSSASEEITSAINRALRFLVEARDASGLWPYLPSRAAALEPSIWALLACRADSNTLSKSVDVILSKQNNDGGWSSELENDQSDWTSYFTFFGLHLLMNSFSKSSKENSPAVSASLEKACKRAFDFVMNSRTDRYNGAAKFLLLIWKGAEQDYNRGWSWTAETYDWVEPTAYAILGLRQTAAIKSEKVARAVSYAEQFLLGLVCSSGGWNFGDRHTYFPENPPDVQSTAIALLSLQARKSDADIKKSLNWLRESISQLENVSDLAWSNLVLSTYGEDTGALSKRLCQLQKSDGCFSSNLLTHSVASLSLQTRLDPSLLSFTSV